MKYNLPHPYILVSFAAMVSFAAILNFH